MALLEWLRDKLAKTANQPLSSDDQPEQEAMYYFENGLMVMTEAYHRNRGYCCGSKCRHCPYHHENVPNDQL